MYADQLEEKTLKIDSVYLDPNNPRFWTEKTTKDIPDRKISDPDIQTRTQTSIDQHGVEELCNSILRNGFLPLDRIVVRPIAGSQDNEFVAVEGNRRLAALRRLRQQITDNLVDEENLTEGYLQQLFDDTDTINVLVYVGADTADIAWLLQGIRHISGVRDWQPAQRARLVADQIDKEGLSFKQAGQKFGLTARSVARLFRAFKALEQMRKDDEFQTRAKNEYFTLFEEAIRDKDVRQWLNWDEDRWEFQDEDNLAQFYSWIVPDEEHPEKERRIHDPRQIKELGFLIAGNHKELLAQIDQHDLSIGGAYERARQVGQKYDWESALRKAMDLISEVPQAAAKMPDMVDTISDRLARLAERLAAIQKMVSAAKG